MNKRVDGLMKELDNYPYVDNIEVKIEEINAEIIFLFSRISESVSAIEADPLFEDLDIIQISLARLLFKHDVDLPERLKVFVYDFDRLDNWETKKTLFSKIKNGAYN